MELMLAIIAIELYVVMIFLWHIKRELIELNKGVEFYGQNIGSDVHMSKITLKIIAGEVIKREDESWKEKE